MEMFPSFSLISGSSAREELNKQMMQGSSLTDKPDPSSAGTFIYECFAQTSGDVPFVLMQIHFGDLTARGYAV